MFKRTAEDLGLDQVLQIISKHALSSLGLKAVLNAKPLSNSEAFLLRQNQVSATIYSIEQANSLENVSVETFPDIIDVFESITRNLNSLTGEQVFNIGLFIRSARKLKSLMDLSLKGSEKEKNSEIANIIEEIPTELLYLEQEIFKILESPGTVKENYPTVKALREKAELTRHERSHVAKQLMHQNQSIMQSDRAVLRDGRIVLPVKNEAKNQVEGYVQSSSSSGGTIFMEPFKLVDMNNKVVIAQEEILLEIARLIRTLSDLVRENEMKLRVLSSQVAKADFLYAFASWCKKNSCTKTLHSQTEYVCNLIKARHPLLGAKCVPIDLSIKTNIKAVVLTGPNAGGKTVTMKTVGLFALINQICGHIPASDGSSLALFDRVFTDIGDDQSIENQLSTFSGHMKSISFILRSMTDKSLVILDELGSGTDPQEGAALARSILEYCTTKALLTLTTSHHGVLKQYAYGSKIVQNASMEFDEKTLEPTFKVISGLPGESHAIDTAKRMRLPKAVTASAEKYMGQEAVKISSIIRNLEVLRRENEQKQVQLEKRLHHIQNQENHIAKELRRLQAIENNLKKEKLKDFDDYMKSSRKNLENLVSELRVGEINREKTLKVKSFISEMQTTRDNLNEEIKKTEEILDTQELEEDNAKADNVELKEGMDVLCGPSKREGTVIKEASKGKWIVAIGPMKFTFKETDLVVPRRTNSAKSYSIDSSSKTPSPKISLDLRGYRLLEALDAIDTQIEACCIYGLKSFSIIHGYGDGILSSGIHRHLNSSELVLSFRFAIPEDGGQGKTYVELK